MGGINGKQETKENGIRTIQYFWGNRTNDNRRSPAKVFWIQGEGEMNTQYKLVGKHINKTYFSSVNWGVDW
ncbi:MAG: hypothetical protein MUO82_11560 [Candidatus Thermoplasmatota archaeon]|nr:hypothetical protein [Candidatus Thermoplasmatota archaeon]